MPKDEKENIKRKLILWYEGNGEPEVGEALSGLILKEKRIIEYRYKDDMCWEYIAEKVEYSRMQCFRVHNKALERNNITGQEARICLSL